MLPFEEGLEVEEGSQVSGVRMIGFFVLVVPFSARDGDSRFCNGSGVAHSRVTRQAGSSAPATSNFELQCR